jgi:hypothetical protein
MLIKAEDEAVSVEAGARMRDSEFDDIADL